MERPRRCLSPDVLWLSDEQPSRIGETWRALANQFSSTGLWPLVLAGFWYEAERPWNTGEFDPSLSSDPATHDAREVVASWWSRAIPSDDGSLTDSGMMGPFGREFPGLAEPAPGPEDQGIAASLADELEGRLGLVPTIRPADAIADLVGDPIGRRPDC
jgi:hypothetical protein